MRETTPLTTSAGSAAVPALVARSVARHDTATFGAERGVADYIGFKLQGSLRIGFGNAQFRRVACLARFSDSEKTCTEPTEDVVDDRLGVGYLRIAGPAAGLKANVTEFIDKELQRHSILQPVADRSRKRVH